MTLPPSVRAFVAGNSGSGKTRTASDLYIGRMPRSIIIDQTGEWGGLDEIVDDLPSLKDAVARLAPRGRWRVVYSGADGGFPDLVRWLIPVPRIDLSPVLALGGACILVDEVDLLAPYGPAPDYIRTLYRRSRHCGLSVVSCTQRPANVSREVSAQCAHVIAHALTEPRDRDYMATLLRWDSQGLARWQEWTRRHPHGCAWKDLRTAECRWLTRRR